ncbi:Glycylpeptide N-tetradecanoyltransferase 2 [Chionoecetes opilio]|uniref:Glycylpeptide N-tetradecanoyltransferase n=1 Tax=Chionoecetes opilio TaxID=41210 RepID=A0A8J4Y1K5_CHIOP|nr:Glycylpeptide N-tetradecanoyltransferase 2 [Chionoecetes opilio]
MNDMARWQELLYLYPPSAYTVALTAALRPQAVYTAGVRLPGPMASCRYWHRSLNPRKLIEVKFSHLGKNMTMQRTLKLYRLPSDTATRGFRRLQPQDVDSCHQLLQTYLKRFDLSPVFNREQFIHWFLPQDKIIDSYVVETGGKVTGEAQCNPQSLLASPCSPCQMFGSFTPQGHFVSYYTLPSTVMHHPTYKTLKAAYSFYNVSSSTPWKVLMKDALITAKNGKSYNNLRQMKLWSHHIQTVLFPTLSDGKKCYFPYEKAEEAFQIGKLSRCFGLWYWNLSTWADYDVFNALDLMENSKFLEELKFGQGDGNLQYYLYNWRCPKMSPEKTEENVCTAWKVD